MRPEPRKPDPKWVVVRLPMADIESAIGRKDVHPSTFAAAAWKMIAGADAEIRATWNHDAELLIDCRSAGVRPLVLAHVSLPRVAFFGWSVPSLVGHPFSVHRDRLLDVRELIPGRWANRLAEALPAPAGSFAEHLDREVSLS